MPKSSSTLIWNGAEIKAKMDAAAIEAINQTLKEAVDHAKNNHPGWKNVTGEAEASVQVLEPAESTAKGVSGAWGSKLFYVPWLEIKNGSFLRAASDAIYPRLADRLREKFDK